MDASGAGGLKNGRAGRGQAVGRGPKTLAATILNAAPARRTACREADTATSRGGQAGRQLSGCVIGLRCQGDQSG